MKITKFIEEDIQKELPFFIECLNEKGMKFTDFEEIKIYDYLDLKLDLKSEIISFYLGDNRFFHLNDDDDLSIIEYIYYQSKKDDIKFKINDIQYIIIFGFKDSFIHIYKISDKEFFNKEIKKIKDESFKYVQESLMIPEKIIKNSNYEEVKNAK